MTLPSTPPLSMSNIATELGVSLPLSLSATNVRTLAGIPSGNISILDLLGKSSITLNSLFVEYAFGAVWGFNDGGGNDGPPFSDNGFGSLSGNSIGGYTTNGLYSCLDNSTEPATPTTYWITRAAFGSGAFNGRSIGIYSGTTLVTSSVLTYIYTVDATQSYTLANPSFFQPYSGQTISVGLI